MELKEGITFANHYLLQKRLGRGSFGEVWLAKNILAEIPVAIKVYGALDDNGITGFREEFQLAYKLSHPNLLHINHFDVADNHPFLVMPYCKNGSSVKQIGNISEMELWRFMRDVSAGLMYLHEQVPNIVHQDIKPDNILINDDNHYVISDFGISHRMSTTFSRLRSEEYVSSGTLAYMAPEHFSQTKVHAGMASDIWSFGMTIYEMATGEVLWNGIGGCAQINGAHTPYEISGFSSRLSALVSSCLMLNAHERPTARQICDMAQSVLDGNPKRMVYERQEQVANSHSNNVQNISTRQSLSPNEVLRNNRFNSKYALIIFAAIICCLFAFWGIRSFAKSINENSDFIECKTIDDYRNFINNYPESEKIEYAKRKLDQLINDSIIEANNNKDYNNPKPTNILSNPNSNKSVSNVIYVNENNTQNKNAKNTKDSSLDNNKSNDYPQQGSDDEDYYFASCRTVTDYGNYLQRFPNGKHVSSANYMIQQLKHETMNTTQTQTIISNEVESPEEPPTRVQTKTQYYNTNPNPIRHINSSHSYNYQRNRGGGGNRGGRAPVRNGRR